MCVGNKECIRLQSDRFIAEALITVMDVSNGRRSILPGDAEGWALHEDSPLEGCLPPPPNPVACVWDLSAPDFLQTVCRGTQRGQVLILLIALRLFSKGMDARPFLKKKKKEVVIHTWSCDLRFSFRKKRKFCQGVCFCT